jgi:hypothetical protein
MQLSDIILPPLEKETDEQQPGSSDSTAIMPMTGSQVVPADGKKKDGDLGLWTVRGRDYSLTLVRAKTVLNKEDLSVPKGEKWNDFTFDPKKLNEDLEITRKKRGDPDPNEMKIGMDNIPSLYQLIEKGNQRKFEKNADKWCRIFELTIFLLMWFLYVLLNEPDGSFATSTSNVAHAVRTDLFDFTLAEQETTGIMNFSEITYPYQLREWIQGPLKRSVLPGGSIQRRNVFPLKMQARVYDTAENPELDVKWCTNDTNESAVDNASNSSDSSCYPESLKTCRAKSVVEIYNWALKKGHTVPPCMKMYDDSIFVNSIKSLLSVDAFSFMSGEISSYLGGHPYVINISAPELYDESLRTFTPAADVRARIPAYLFNLFNFLPTQKAVYILRLLIEFSPSGPIITSYREAVVNLEPADTVQDIFFIAAIALAITVLLLELRRITGFPERIFWENRKQPCGCYLFIFILVPLLMIFAFAIMQKQVSMFAETVDAGTGQHFDISHLEDHSFIEDEEQLLETVFPDALVKPEPYRWRVSENVLFDLQAMIYYDNALLITMLITFLLLFILSFRYFLVFFPELRYITVMIQKAAMPVFVAFVCLVIAFLCFIVLFYIMFSEMEFEYRSWMTSTMAVIKFAHGGFMRWEHIYLDYEYSWIALMVASFFVFTMMLNNLLIAVLVSHKKEAELHKNYSSHPFWQQLHRTHMQRNAGGELNPALAGFDFNEYNPKEGPKDMSQQTPGWKI